MTELSWRVHCTAPEDKVKLAQLLSKAIKDHKATSGYPEYEPGRISIGNISVYFRSDLEKQQDYKFAKVECENRGDYEALLDMKYINIENNISRLLPNMSKEDIAKYFNNQEHNCFVKGIPAGWDHKDLYNYFC